jgi:hypothetical protein
MTRFKYYVIELLAMPSKKHHCNLCGHEWKGPMSPACPNCHETDWWEGGSCGFAGGVCDICGCEFRTLLLQDKYCPNCGSKRWNHIATDRRRRLEDVHPWVMEKTKGDKTYTYWMASWREGDKVHNVHLGSCKKMSQVEATEKARAMKAKALRIGP